ncbi:MAG TPA: feruloyl-CoA synthase [Byssovorax sp.]|jgi:feruloyl-CoA synthase
MLELAPARVDVERRADGAVVLRSPVKLGAYARCVGDWLVAWAARAPERTFLAERAGDAFRETSYAAALEAVRRAARGLLERGLGPDKPLAILSDNAVEAGLLALAAQHVGVPVAPISPAYSLLSKDFAKLRAVFAALRPGLVYAAQPAKFGAALEAVGARATPFDELASEPAHARVDAAFASIGPDTVAKILFTSGSTDTPKGVVNTQRMLCASQEALALGWPFVERAPPVLVDWLPWNHTFGGNHNFNLVLRSGGSLYVDGGKPAPALVEITAANLRLVSPTIYFNVPRGFDLLLPLLEADASLAAAFFRRLDAAFYAAAALPQNLWQRLEGLARVHGLPRFMMLSAWGATETSPLATQVHFSIPRAGVVGLPVAGCDIKLVPSADKFEARVRGPNVTPGYLGPRELTERAFDDEGFYKTGDAMRFADDAAPEKGLVFDGRIAEDFKLTTGTWVMCGAVRTRLIAACDPFVQDAVITGHDRDEIGALVFLTPAGASVSPVELRARLEAALDALAKEPGGSSTCPRRLRVQREPPSLDAGEITDKGYVNQRVVRERRAAEIDRLYAQRDRIG